MTEASTERSAHPVVLFDGVCNLCNFAVQFILDRDREGIFKFASLQSKAGGELLSAHGKEPPVGDPESVVLIEDGKVYEHSTAALRIALRLRGLWRVFYALIVLPAFFRDAVYRWIARNRYRWFGKVEQCRVPTPELRARFLV